MCSNAKRGLADGKRKEACVPPKKSRRPHSISKFYLSRRFCHRNEFSDKNWRSVSKLVPSSTVDSVVLETLGFCAIPR